MAANSKAIGLLFEVAGGGNINGETGNRGDGASTSYVSGSLPLNSDGTIRMEIGRASCRERV